MKHLVDHAGTATAANPTLVTDLRRIYRDYFGNTIFIEMSWQDHVYDVFVYDVVPPCVYLTLSCHVMSCHTISHIIISYHIISYHIISYVASTGDNMAPEDTEMIARVHSELNRQKNYLEKSLYSIQKSSITKDQKHMIEQEKALQQSTNFLA